MTPGGWCGLALLVGVGVLLLWVDWLSRQVATLDRSAHGEDGVE